MDIHTGLSLRLRTNAKLNLFLRVLGRRPDGYHELESIFHGVDLGDDLEVFATTDGRIDVNMRFAEDLSGEVPAVKENIVARAAEVLIERGARNEGLRIEITKRIPIGAGLGGGSGNAAGALVALNELWGMDLGKDAMNEVASLVGSDVPYCLGGGTALATARGEQLTQLPSPDSMTFVLGISEIPLYTRDVYDAWDEIGAPEEVGSAPMTLALGSGDPSEVASLLHNDLEPAAFRLRPELEGRKKEIVRAGALGVSMSGSGPTMFGIAADEEHARDIAGRLQSAFDRVVVAGSKSPCVERLN